jgi:hypothetical protein
VFELELIYPENFLEKKKWLSLNESALKKMASGPD